MMRHPGLTVFTASALGAFIGSLLGLQFTPTFWWVGMLVGGLTGYLAYEPRTVVAALGQVFGVVFRDLNDRQWGWRWICLMVGNWRMMLWTIAGTLTMFLWIMMFVGVLYYFGGTHPHDLTPLFTIGLSTLMGRITWMMALMMGLVFSMFSASTNQAPCESFREMAKYGTPPVVLFYWMPRLLMWLTPRLLPAFRLIHSDRRLLCGIDGAIGAGIGTFAHNPLIGAVVGGALGLLDYELVSKRWLKLISD